MKQVVSTEINAKCKTMNRSAKVEVDNKIITVIQNNELDFICLTDMVRGEEGGRQRAIGRKQVLGTGCWVLGISYSQCWRFSFIMLK